MPMDYLTDFPGLDRFPELLLPWFSVHRRDLPWRADRDPYHVWLSEIMLQQTRIEAVLGYYKRFLDALPDLSSLANCGEDRLLKLWEGLGYYSRARNLQKAAKIIMDQGGVFPNRYEELRALPGIGDYTAGAIASISFGLPCPAVDGNVLRVVSRVCNWEAPVTRPESKRALCEALKSVYPVDQAGEFTQALMEIGEVLCIPNGIPNCEACPLRELCLSRKGEKWKLLPVKEAKKPRRIEEKTVFLLHCGDRIALRKRDDRGLLAGLWEFPNEPGILSMTEALAFAEKWGCRPLGPEKTVAAKHIFTHVEWRMTGHYLACRKEAGGFVWADKEELEHVYSLPTAFKKLLD